MPGSARFGVEVLSKRGRQLPSKLPIERPAIDARQIHHHDARLSVTPLDGDQQLHSTGLAIDRRHRDDAEVWIDFGRESPADGGDFLERQSHPWIVRLTAFTRSVSAEVPYELSDIPVFESVLEQIGNAARDLAAAGAPAAKGRRRSRQLVRHVTARESNPP